MAFDNSVSRAEESRFRFMVIADLEFELAKRGLESAGDGGKRGAVFDYMTKELYALDSLAAILSANIKVGIVRGRL